MMSWEMNYGRDRNIAKFLPGPGPAQTKKAGRSPPQNYVICKK